MKLLSGENIPANAMQRTIQRFWVLENIEYGMFCNPESPFCCSTSNVSGFVCVMTAKNVVVVDAHSHDAF